MEDNNKVRPEMPSGASESLSERNYDGKKDSNTVNYANAQNGSGSAIRKRKTFGRKLLDKVFSDDPIGVSERVKNEVIWPGLKELGYNILQSSISMLFWGESRGGRGRRDGYRSDRGSYRDNYEDYGKYSRENSSDRRRDRRASYDFGEIIFMSKEKADDALGYLRYCVDRFDHATVANLNEKAELSSKYTDWYYGWYDLKNAAVYPMEDGWVIDLPPAEPIRTR